MVVTLPTLVLRRRVRTTGVVRPSWKSSMMVGAHGGFHRQAFPTLLQAPISGYIAQSQHLTDRWWRGCHSQLTHSSTCWTEPCRSSRRGTIQLMRVQRGAGRTCWLPPSPPFVGLGGSCRRAGWVGVVVLVSHATRVYCLIAPRKNRTKGKQNARQFPTPQLIVLTTVLQAATVRSLPLQAFIPEMYLDHHFGTLWQTVGMCADSVSRTKNHYHCHPLMLDVPRGSFNLCSVD